MPRGVIPLGLALAAALMGCSPAQQCRQEASRDYRALDREIAETQRNIDRGYGLRPVHNPFRFGLTLCSSGNPAICAAADDWPDYRQVPVDVEVERAKLGVLVARRDRMAPQVRAALAACPAQ